MLDLFMENVAASAPVAQNDAARGKTVGRPPPIRSGARYPRD